MSPNTRKLRDVTIATIVAIALYMSGVLAIFTPLPIMYVSVVHGRTPSIATAIFALGLIALFYSPWIDLPGGASWPSRGFGMASPAQTPFVTITSVGYLVFFETIAIALGEGIRRKWGLEKLGGVAIIAGACVVIIATALAKFSVSTGVTETLRTILGHAVDEAIKMNQAVNIRSPEFGFIGEHKDEVVAYILKILPALLSVFILLTVIMNILLGRRLIRGHHSFAHIHNVARFRLPDAIVWALVAGGVTFFADSYIIHAGWPKVVSINCLIALGALYFFQGLAVVVYFLQGIRAPLFKMLAYMTIVFFFQAVSVVIVAVGFADIWLDFRLRVSRLKHGH